MTRNELSRLKELYYKEVEFGKMLIGMKDKSSNPSMYKDVIANQIVKITEIERAFTEEGGR